MCTLICILTVTVTLDSLDTFRRGAILHCMHKVSQGYQNNDQSVGLIPKWDPGITNF